MNIVLASGSPRRQELLKRIIEDFHIEVSNFDESSIGFTGDIDKYVCELAEGKARGVLHKFQDESIIIGCDTVVYLNGKILGKPSNREEAIKMLKELSGKTHQVYSGLAMINNKTNKVLKKSICTEVKFTELSDNMILKYVESGQSDGKAGAYGIQDGGAIYVESINGCYYNVVGFSLNTVFLLLREMGVNL